MSQPEPSEGAVFEIERIRRLVELMETHDLDEVDLREGGQRIRLRRGGPQHAPMPFPIAPPPPPPPAPASGPPHPSAEPVAAAKEDKNITYIKSPMVGTYYSRPNPNATPFVKVGDHVDPETTVCIIEAMKVFNEIPAEVRGRIVAVLVDEEEPVEFGKPLFKIDTSG